ncbi:MAG: hypothetical protein HC830_01760 [Bacteroidetes bacterium]|nr:hypothetical protein [Bacteroidota bacterium]
MGEQQVNLTQLLDTFQLFDTNKDGSITLDEVCIDESMYLKVSFSFHLASIRL